MAVTTGVGWYINYWITAGLLCHCSYHNKDDTHNSSDELSGLGLCFIDALVICYNPVTTESFRYLALL